MLPIMKSKNIYNLRIGQQVKWTGKTLSEESPNGLIYYLDFDMGRVGIGFEDGFAQCYPIEDIVDRIGKGYLILK